MISSSSTGPNLLLTTTGYGLSYVVPKQHATQLSLSHWTSFSIGLSFTDPVFRCEFRDEYGYEAGEVIGLEHLPKQRHEDTKRVQTAADAEMAVQADVDSIIVSHRS
ncbi:FMN-dependent dehydrogenase [Penicillium vulpinum]|uniref:FMN-dependent dehydrogenase n=1 Tax=Penicillium vulpinum TaxID=29845 RepID=UPI0025494B89|nr:FMN-dependent dehydrogenase [Penicillium vulpinum]KAJ5951633.1 FMN-dependent dehydrogenase [Penicillium vulpinum]